MLRKIYDFVIKETEYKNESAKTRKVARYTLLLSIVISFAELILDIAFYKGRNFGYCLIAPAVFIVMFVLSYQVRSARILGMTMLVWLPWLFVQIWLFGWNLGAQQLIFLMLMISFLCSYDRLRNKVFMATALFLLTVGLFGFSRNPRVVKMTPSSDMAYIIMQCLITFFVYFGVGALCYIYFKDSQTQEGQLVQYNIKLENEANTDALTGLYNRRRVLEKIQKIYDEQDPSGFSIAMCDVDFFKKVNDNYGHDVGDEVLKGIAKTMKEATTEDIFAARWGGEEFLLVFNHCNGDQALVYLYDILNKIRNLQFNITDRSFSVTMTMGLAEYDFKSDVDGMVKQADEKMYNGKENGRNQIVF